MNDGYVVVEQGVDGVDIMRFDGDEEDDDDDFVM